MTTINEIVGNYVPINQIEKEYRTNFIYDELRIYDNGKNRFSEQLMIRIKIFIYVIFGSRMYEKEIIIENGFEELQ